VGNDKGFNRGLRVDGQSPGRRRAEAALWRAAKVGGAIEKMVLDRCVLSSLTGLVLFPRHNPAMNRWAIFERLCGTWNCDTLNTCLARGWNFESNRVAKRRLGTAAVCEAPAAARCNGDSCQISNAPCASNALRLVLRTQSRSGTVAVRDAPTAATLFASYIILLF